jgi:hypothetical protein
VLADVTRLAGVSLQIVSRVVNDALAPSSYARRMRSVRIATALCLILALPGLILGFVVSAAPTRSPCDRASSSSGLLNLVHRTGGEPCRPFDFTMLYWFLPVVVLLVIGLGIARAQRSNVRVTRAP